MAQRLRSLPVSPLRFLTQLCITIPVLCFLLSYTFAALPHTPYSPHSPHSTSSTNVYALNLAEAAFPQYTSITESAWPSSDNGDQDSPGVSADMLQPIEVTPRKHTTFKLAVLLPHNMTARNYIFRTSAIISMTTAIKLAVEDINQARILPVNISMKSYDSQPPEDNPFSGSNAMLQASIMVTNNVTGVIGDAFSWLTEYSAMLTSALSIPQCSFSATSDSLSDPKLYATFFRTVSASNEQGQIMTAYVQKMGWRRLSVLYSDDTYGRALARTINDEAARFGLRVLKSEPIYPPGGDKAEVGIDDVLTALEDAGSYINMIMATDVLVYQAMEEIQRRGMFSYPYVWIVINNIYNDIQRYFQGPTHPPASSFDGLVMFDPQSLLEDEPYLKFKERWLKLDPNVYQEAGPNTEVTEFDIRAYSCAWMIALCYEKDIGNARARGISEAEIIDQLLIGSYPRTIGNFSTELFSTLSYDDGPAGPIKLNQFGNAINLASQFFQIQNNKMVLVANASDTPDGLYRPVSIVGTHKWPGVPVTVIPKDGPSWVFQNLSWNDAVARFMYVLVAIGVAESLIVIGVVLWQRHNPVIKAASVLFSILELLGIIMLFFTVLMRIGMYSDAICIASPLIFSLGFTLLMGSLAVKSLREYRLHNNILRRGHLIRDWRLLKQLAIIFAVFMIPAVIYMIVVRPHVRYLALGDGTDAWACTRSQDHVSVAAESVLVIIWCAPFPLLAAASAHMTGGTRDTSMTWNESRLIRYTMYNFLLFFVMFIPTLFLDEIHFRVILMIQNITTLFSLHASLLILFGPKIFQIWRLHVEKLKSSDPSKSSNDPSYPLSLCTQEEQARYELAIRQYGFLSADSQGSQPTPRRRKTTLGRRTSIERQALFSFEPTPKGPAAYSCTTGSLKGPDISLNNLNNEVQARRRPGSQDLSKLHSDNTTSIPRSFGAGDEDDHDECDAIPVLDETNVWFVRVWRQWRPMRVVVVVSLNLVILADDAKATIETCLYSSVTPVTEAGHYYMRIHCPKNRTLLLEFSSEEARDQWIIAFELPTDEMRINNHIFAGPASGGGALSHTQQDELLQETSRHQVEQNTATHPFTTDSSTLSDPE